MRSLIERAALSDTRKRNVATIHAICATMG